MKRGDFACIVLLAALFIPFILSGSLYDFYLEFNSAHGFIASFIKFAILATAGEVIGLRIRTGEYSLKGFGLIPRAAVWGFLGIAIKAAFTVFQSGTVSLLEYSGFSSASELFSGPLSAGKVFVAFSVSLLLNLVFSPVLMTLHRITDMHIMKNGGSVFSLFRAIDFRESLQSIDWGTHWNFVLKKTIPFFWIPAHTLTFLLPPDFQVLFAAALGIVLGVILAFAAGGRSKE